MHECMKQTDRSNIMTKFLGKCVQSTKHSIPLHDKNEYYLAITPLPCTVQPRFKRIIIVPGSQTQDIGKDKENPDRILTN